MKDEIILEEGEILCDKCKGTRVSWITTTPCSKCQGAGKVDWITNAMGDIEDLWWPSAGYHRGVVIDVDKGGSGITYPIGTSMKPVNNIRDAQIIAKERGLIYDK